MNFSQDIVLEDNRVLLRPLLLSDVAQLKPMALDEDTWKYNVSRISSEEELQRWAEDAIRNREARLRYTFAILDKESNLLAGSTSYGNISVPDKRLEIGWTWLGKLFRGSGLNRHCKFLLLSYVFDVLQFERVELKTDVLNQRSRKAMLKLGATEEGILRSHTLMHDGRRRDTIYYSILRHEWQHIKHTIFPDMQFSYKV